MNTASIQETAPSNRTARLCQIFAWTLVSVVSILAFVVWGKNHSWQFRGLTTYQLFPLLGLLAFSIMWSHYVSGFLREVLKLQPKVLSRYFSATSYAVLSLICLHPSLLIYQRFRDGYGLPPHSYESYVAPGMGWITLLGTFSLFIFLIFEFRKVYGKRPWWRYVLVANDIAMVSVFYHGLQIGSDIQGWFRIVWLFYGVTLIAILMRKYYLKFAKRRNTNPTAT